MVLPTYERCFADGVLVGQELILLNNFASIAMGLEQPENASDAIRTIQRSLEKVRRVLNPDSCLSAETTGEVKAHLVEYEIALEEENLFRAHQAITSVEDHL